MFQSFSRSIFIFSLISFFALVSCGDSSKDQPQENNKEEAVNSKDGMPSDLKEMAEMMTGDMTEGKNLFRQLVSKF
ncbi:MAG: hypothetical protein HXY50_08610 [Ignavibacteriaceae bacterium]|nr:hypothetical protein [Ignavibacteriaceae bacterium]